MEESQLQQHIGNNLTELAKETTSSEEFLKMFTSRNLLEPSQVANLKSPTVTPVEKSKHLYQILSKQPQPGSIDVLIQSLEETKQIKALKILLDSSSIFRNYGAINYDKDKLLSQGCLTGDKIYKGRFDGRNVSVKVMNAEILDTKLALKEVDMLKKLDGHENIVRYFTVEARAGSIQIALELFEVTLQDQIKLNVVNAIPVKILKKCTKGLAYLHSMNVIHTDLNPSNVLLTANGQVKICNFGFAQQISNGLGSASVTLENVRNKDWMAPEILRHFAEDESDSHIIEVSSACDVFSLGCIYFFVLTKGAHPFGNPVMRQSNIYCDKPQLENSSLDLNSLQLIKGLITHAASDRPSASKALSYYSFATKICSYSHRKTSTMTQPTQLAPDLETTSKVTPQVLDEISKTPAPTKRSLPSGPKVHSESPCSSSTAKKRKVTLRPQTKAGQTSLTLTKQGQPDDVDELGNNEIFRAVLEGKELAELKRMVENASDMKRVNNAGESVPHLAVQAGNPEVINLLINTGIQINVDANNGEAPVHAIRFTKQNFKETLDMLLRHGAKINASDKVGDTVLGLAALAGRSKADLEYIISKGGNMEARNLNGDSILHLAAKGGNPEAIKFLIELGAAIDSKNKLQEVPLHQIAFTKNDFKGSVDVLIENGANVNEQDEFGETILHNMSTISGRPKTDLEYIVGKGANWQLRNKKGQSVLHLAAKVGNIEAIRYFISMGASINSKDKREELPLHALMFNKRNFKETLNVLLEYGTSINATNKDGDNLLNLAACKGMPREMLEFIIKMGGIWKKKNNAGRSILHFCALGGNVDALKYFISLGAKVNVRDKDGETPMHFLAYAKENFKECVDVLLDHGANINAKCKTQFTLLDLIEFRKDEEDIKYVISKGGIGEYYGGKG